MPKVMQSVANRIHSSPIGWMFNMELWREPLCFLGLIALMAYTMFLLNAPFMDQGTKNAVSAVMGWLICLVSAIGVGIFAFAIWQKCRGRSTSAE